MMLMRRQLAIPHFYTAKKSRCRRDFSIAFYPFCFYMLEFEK